jgi:hypothetical protein
MIRRIKAWALGLAASAMLAACGGGGGDPGDCVLCNGGPTDPDAAYAVVIDVQRSGASVSAISSSETVQAVARVVDNNGVGVEGVLVTFTESNATLLKFAPDVGTALTGADGIAELDISALTTSSAGATTVNATAAVGGTSYESAKSISISASGVVEIVDPSAINFISVVPAGQAIVIKGAGGNGRSESASLTFKVVDANNAPVKGAAVSFTVNPLNKVTLNIPTATSDLDGLVTTTVQSGTEPTSVVVTATATTSLGVTVSGQSDTLVVSNGVAVAGGFEIVAAKYNLDGLLTGDKTTVTAFVRDENGNPVPDGVAVSFTTDFGGIASSDLGGCLTTNGTCDVDFRVQDPRGGGLATVIATVNVGADSSLADSIPINMAGATGGSYVAVDDVATGHVPTVLTMGSCKQTFDLYLEDDDTGRSVAAGTVIGVGSKSSNISASITFGSPVLDSLSFTPTLFSVEIDASSTDLFPLCDPTGTVDIRGSVLLTYTTPNGISFAQRFSIAYPAN